jgi:site-specific DNA recombinase
MLLFTAPFRSVENFDLIHFRIFLYTIFGIQRQALLEMLREKKAQALVVVSLDRLTRSVKDLGCLVEFFEKSQAALVAAHDSIDTFNAAERLVLNVQANYFRFEKKRIK